MIVEQDDKNTKCEGALLRNPSLDTIPPKDGLKREREELIRIECRYDLD
jgi:hypothetical protein